MNAKLQKMLDGEDKIVASGADLDWLIDQLIAWPVRVDEANTANLRFLMNSAAATLLAIAIAPKAETEGLRSLRTAKRGAKQSPKVSQ